MVPHSVTTYWHILPTTIIPINCNFSRGIFKIFFSPDQLQRISAAQRPKHRVEQTVIYRREI